ncbi:hypothetical protein AMTRI_Chr06g173650 [Amborella trichopoda]
MTFMSIGRFPSFVAKGQRCPCFFCFWLCDFHVNWGIPFFCWRYEGVSEREAEWTQWGGCICHKQHPLCNAIPDHFVYMGPHAGGLPSVSLNWMDDRQLVFFWIFRPLYTYLVGFDWLMVDEPLYSYLAH